MTAPTAAEKIVSHRLSLGNFTSQTASLSLASSNDAPSNSSSGVSGAASEAVHVDDFPTSNSAAWFGALDGDSEYGDGHSDEEETPVVKPDLVWNASDWPASPRKSEDQGLPPLPPPLAPPQATRKSNGTLKLQRRPTGGGIMSRLRRINKKEAKVSDKSLDVSASPAAATPAAAAAAAPRQEEQQQHQQQHTSPEPLPMRVAEDTPLHFRDAPLEHSPYLIDQRSSHIHSLQPSLVDDESILQRSELGSDEEKEQESILILDANWLEGKVREKREAQFGFNDVKQHAREATTFADAHSRQPTEYVDASVAQEAVISPAVTYAALTIAKQTGWQEEEDAVATPKGHQAEASRTDYFDVPADSSSSSTADTATASSTWAQQRYSTVATTSSALTSAAAASSATSASLSAAFAPPVLLNLTPLAAQTWLMDSHLSPQHLYIFLREMCSVQLRWELNRAWLLCSVEAPSKPAALGRDDLAIFKRDPFDSALPQPLLPLVRFLLTRAVLPCPLFAHTSHGAGAPDVQTWFRQGVAPLLKQRQKMSLSQAVDRQGEGDGTRFNSKTTLEVLRATWASIVVDYLTAVVRHSLPPGTAEPIPFPKETTSVMPVDEYYAHRLPASKLKQGGFELDIVGLRARSANECEFVICIKRYGYPYAYVIRDENDFFEYARGLSAELGPRARVRPLPRSGTATDGAHSEGSVGTMAGSGVAALLGSARTTSATRRDSISSTTSMSLGRPHAVDLSPSLSSGSTSGATAAAAAAASRLRLFGASQTATPAAPLQRPALSRVDSSDSAKAATLSAKFRAFGAVPGAQTSQISLTPSERGMPRGRSTVHLASPPLLQDPSTPFAAPTAAASTRTVDSTSEAKRSRIFSSGSKRAPSPSAGPTLRYKGSNGSLKDKQQHQIASMDPSASAHHEARRHELRHWLRDALSVRGAGHCSETKSFLATGAFSDREMRPGTKADIELRARIDEERGAEREAVAAGSAEEVLELHEELQSLWIECVEKDGFAKAYAALRASPSFSALSMPYQRAISWGNLQAACLLYGVFIGGSQSSKNLIRAQDLFNAVPWSAISLAVREPTGLMAQRVKTALVGEAFVDRLLAVLLEDGAGPGMRAELDELRKRFGSPVYRKLESFAELPDAKKRLIRQAAQDAGLPLVSTIARGSDVPRLAEAGIKRIVTATKAWQEFMNTGPTPQEIHTRIKASADVRLIADMQRALRLLSLLRDARLVREAIVDSQVQAALATLLDPLLHALRRIHRATSLTNIVTDVKAYIARVLDVLAGLRARVIEPWKCISTLATLLDDAVPAWYGFVHNLSGADSLAEQVFGWLQSLATLVGCGCTDIAAQWAPPRSSTFTVAPTTDEHDRRSIIVSDNLAPLDVAARSSITDLTAAALRQRTEDFKQACRWAAGDVDGAETIQIQGAAGKSRTDRIYVSPPKPAKPSPGLEKLFRPAFRDALARALR